MKIFTDEHFVNVTGIENPVRFQHYAGIVEHMAVEDLEMYGHCKGMPIIEAIEEVKRLAKKKIFAKLDNSAREKRFEELRKKESERLEKKYGDWPTEMGDEL